MFAINLKKERHEGKTRTLNFNRAKFTKLLFILHTTKWDQILVPKNTEGKWECFKDIVNNSICQCILLDNKYNKT